MANVFLSAVLLSSVLAVSGCIGGLPNIGALGAALGGQPSYGGGYPSYGGGQSYPYNPGAGGGYAQPDQSYYQSQSYGNSGNPGGYVNQQGQSVPYATQGYPAAPPGRWIDRREQRQQERINQGLASGQLTPQEAARLQNQQGRIRGAQGQMGANGRLGYQERTRLNGMQQRSNQNNYRLRHNGVQSGPLATSGSGAPATHGPTPGRSTQRWPAHNDGGTP